MTLLWEELTSPNMSELDLLARAGAEESVPALRLLHKALMAAPVEGEGLVAEARQANW